MRACPFCGGESLKAVERVIPGRRGDAHHWYIRCNICAARGSLKLSEGEAVLAWDAEKGVKCAQSAPNLFDNEEHF